MSGWVGAVGVPVGKKVSAARRGVGRMGLLPAVAFALVAGSAVAGAAYGLLRWVTPVDASKLAAEIDITRVALTVVAGVGGVVALVIAYRRQRDLEQSRFVERFGAAAAQLGATDVAVRIAGVYAMAGVADESDGLRRQQCIDVLCGYLRLPYDAEHGASGRTKFVIKAPRVDRGRVQGETEETVEYRQNDREVRMTIVRVIADHLRPEAEHSWSFNNFDFRTAHLEDAGFHG
ncbi:pentapeptide repeat-containing protein, partial [Nocardia fusca]